MNQKVLSPSKNINNIINIKRVMYEYVIFFIILLIIITIIKLLNHRYSPKICVLVTGFAPRGLRYTHETIQKRIVDKLKLKYNTVDVYHYSFISKKNLIDSNRKKENNLQINNNDVNLLKVKKLITEYQEIVDKDIMTRYVTKPCISKNNHQMNPNRELYQEYMLTKFPIQNYDACVLVWSDAYILRDINLQHIENVVQDNNLLYTTSYNEYGGIANKFYICSSRVMMLLAQRIFYQDQRCSQIFPKRENHETTLKWWVDYLNIKNKHTDMFYVRIRATMNTTFYEQLKNFLKMNPSYEKLFEYDKSVGSFKLKIK